MAKSGVILDLDDTLVDTSALAAFRQSRRWKDAVGAVHLTRKFQGVDAFVGRLAAQCVPWAVVTTSVSFYADRVLGHHGLTPHTRIAYHDARPKPSPDGVVLALRRLGCEAGAAVGVGDSALDLAAYRAAGIKAIGAGWSAALADGNWDAVAASPEEVLALMGLDADK